MFRPVPRPNAPRAPQTSAPTYWLTRTTDRIWAVRFEGLQIKDLTLSFPQLPAAAQVVTASLGVCCKPLDAVGTAACLLRGADAQLHQAKAQGRARACGALLEAA